MKNTIKMPYEAPKSYLMTLDAQDIITNSRAFMGEEDSLTMDDEPRSTGYGITWRDK